MRRVSVFGATGSVGQNTLDLIARRSDEFDVVALSGGANVDLLARQARALRAEHAVIAQENLLPDLRDALAGSGIKASAGRDAVLAAAAVPVDWAMSAVVGFAGLEISLAIARNTKTLALANKESLVCGGALLTKVCAENDTLLLPVDSEHSAILQCIGGADKEVERIILTASGGPFLHSDPKALETATPEQAMAHPNWDMGQRISIDSASMFNKAMEVLETHALFDVTPDQIEVIIHPQSIIHSMVGFADGAIMAHLGPADMRGPIGFALNWPDRVDLPLERLDFGALGALSFQHPDPAQFPALELASQTMQMGGLAGAAFNAAKEAALDLFLDRRIGFLDMARVVRAVLAQTDVAGNDTLSIKDVIDADAIARVRAVEAAQKGF
ncbi:1-deoxy-D-xylulose-5-phosphate reductoisomerase [Neptunicoccus sediminis]|uniref:1-deoxy-D-xylulose-5-phosphate reductoisomerase n=1 Tax=Neptunicoccus sediminis TaxID=1892596 RepID=UPI000845FF30|nr:1-deoxy-D-xylulose-5-phosphate reductoisomerase [Neptunicoccus sediminis]